MMNSTASLNRVFVVGLIVTGLCGLATRVDAVTDNYFGTSGTISGSVWSTNPVGPYTSAFNTTGGGVMNFGNTVTAVTGGSLSVAGINATADVSGWTAGGTISNVGNAVIPITVANGVTLDFGSQSFTSSATAGYIFSGPGTLALAGNTYGGGFTLNSGTVIVRGVNALGGGATNTLTINGGTIAANATRNLTGKFSGGISIAGDVTFGAATGLANNTAQLTFSNDVGLGGATRTITIGNDGRVTLNGVISDGGLIVDASGVVAGRVYLRGQNTFAGGVTIKTNATVSADGISSTGVGPITSGPLGTGTLTVDGGKFIVSSNVSVDIANPITLNSFATNELSVGSSAGSAATLSGDITGAGGFHKSSSGTLIFTGAKQLCWPHTCG